MLELRILNGLHRGAAMQIQDTHVIKIGSGDDSDVLISDNGIDELHLTLEMQAEYGLVLDAIGKVQGEDGVLVEQSIIVERLHCFSLNGIWIGIADTTDDWDIFGELPASFASLSLVEDGDAENYNIEPIKMSWKSKALAIIGLLMLTGWATANVFIPKYSNLKEMDNNGLNSATKNSLININQEQASQKEETKKIVKKFYSREEMSDALNNKLLELQLNKFVDINYSAEGWQINGNMDDEDRLRLERAVQSFNAQFKPKFPITINIMSATTLLPFKVTQIISGKLAGITTEDGQRIFIGDSLDGYRLVAVQGNKASFDGKRKIDVSL
jgi:type III secretion protein D